MRASVFALMICLIALPVYAKYSGGSGEPNDPYQIATAEDLMLLGETPEDYDKHFIMTADIDLDPNLPGRKVFDRAVIAPDTDTNTWYLDGTTFTGVFDGSGHAISHLTIVGESNLGLFGQLGNLWTSVGGEVKNLGIVEIDMTGSGNSVGGLVGANGGEIRNCYITGKVSGVGCVGGLVGANHLVRGRLHSYYRLAGLIAQCYSKGMVIGSEDVGGLVGANAGEVTNCYSMSAVSGDNCVGGLVGSNGIQFQTSNNPMSFAGLVAQCYSGGAVTGTENVGGLVGSYGCYGDGVVSHSFWDIQTSGRTTSAGGMGKTTAELQMANTFPIAWGTCGNEGVWTIDEGNDYPRLSWERKAGEALSFQALAHFLMGTGSESDPFLIYTPEELNMVGLYPCEWDKHFKLMADIDLSGFDGIDGRPIFNIIAPDADPNDHWDDFQGTPFTGVLDGDGHTISHLTIAGASYVGLFGRLELGADVENLGVVDVDIVGSGTYVGALVGSNQGILINCYSTGVIVGWGYTGGLVGLNRGSIGASYSTGIVSGNNSVGGLVGLNSGSIGASYSGSMVSGNWPRWNRGSAGGLVGHNNGSIATSYSSGVVTATPFVGGLIGTNYKGTVTASFWDTQTSGWAISAGGIGKTTTEMQTAKTFLEAGWDFVGETENGTEDIWWILEGQDYPRLWWETR